MAATTASTGCINDDEIGPTVRGCRGDFDFTLKFEAVVLCIIPTAVFIALAAARLASLAQRQKIVDCATLQFFKLGAVTAYATLQFALLVLLTAFTGGNIHGLIIASTAVTFCASILMMGLSFAEHARSPRPSALLSAYVFLTLLFDIAIARTWWLVADGFETQISARLFTCSMAVKVLILILEAQRKSGWIKWNAEDHSPEESIGIYTLSAYSWLSTLFFTGYKGILRMEDLFPLDSGMLSTDVYQRFETVLAKNQAKMANGKTRHIVWVIFSSFNFPILLPAAPRIAMIGFMLCQPFFIETLLKYLSVPAEDTNPNLGYGLIGAAFFVYAGIGISSGIYYYFVERSWCMIRGALATAVYRKTMRMKLSGESDDKAAMTLMSTDIERIRPMFRVLHDWWASPVQIGIGCWLLYRTLGLAFISPIIVIILCAMGTSVVGRYSGPGQAKWMAALQSRVGLTSASISQMKSFKISGIVEPVANQIQQLRVNEIAISTLFRYVLIVGVAISFLPQTLAPVVTLAATSHRDEFTVSQIYTAFSYLVLITLPLSTLIQIVPSIMSGFVCLKRIQNFLETEDRVDFRGIEGVSKKLPLSGLNEKASQSDDSTDGVAMTVKNGSFGWEADVPVLRDINITIPTGKLTMVVGPVASGKSTLCKVLLGEIPVFQGRVCSYLGRPAIGYCEQTPFLQNATLKENVIGYSSYNAQKYEEVIHATLLATDIGLLPSGDDTKIGSNGIMLSGGQKQRVSLARALYLESPFIVCDDILSGLDNDTGMEVFQRVFGSEGLLGGRGATVVLCTHSISHLPSSDHIIALETNGRVVEEGSFDDLMKNNKYISGLGVKSPESDTSSEHAPRKERGSLPVKNAKSASLTSALDERARRLGDWAVYRHYFSRVPTYSIVLMITSAIIGSIGSNLSTIWLKFWAEDTFNIPIVTAIAIFGVLRISELIGLVVQCLAIFITMISFSGKALHKSVLDAVVHAPLSFFTGTDSGIVTTLFSQDMTLIDQELPMALGNVVFDGITVIGNAVVVATASPYLVIGYPFLIAVLYGIQKFYLRTSRQLRLMELETKSPLYSHFMDTIRGVTTIRAFGWAQDDIQHNHSLLDNSQRPAYLLAMIQQWLELTLKFVVTGLAVVVVTIATQLRTNSGFTGASLVTLMTFGDQITYIIRYYTMLETSIGAVSRVKTFSEKVVAEDLEGEDIVPGEEWPEAGAIEITNVSASYGDPSEESEKGKETDIPKLALKNITLSIPPGQKVAISGRTGSGKSSLILLLLRLLDPVSQTQHMEIDGVPLNRINRTALRKRLITIPQDAVFLPDGSTIKQNIDPFGAASDDTCVEVLAAVQLGDFVEARGGIHAGMTADGLSAGQKQLFSLGRAALRRRIREAGGLGELSAGKSKERVPGGVLLLDEVSSSVDRETDRLMQEVIKREFEGYTIIMISHRLEMVMDYFDRVVVLDQGSVVEDGAPKELVGVEGGRFGELWAIGNRGRS